MVAHQEPEAIVQPIAMEPSSTMEVVVASTPPNEAAPFLAQETVGSSSPSQPMQVDDVAEASTSQWAAASSTSSPNNPQEHLSASTTAPMAISRTASSTSVNSPGQQSPSSAFLMAPSPPMFVSSFGISPIPFAAPASSSSPQSQQPAAATHHHGSVSPSNHVSHMLRGAQNFVRNITIPHRNRSRTNSNSAASPTSLPGSASAHGMGQQSSSGTEVLGKTLVMTPPLLLSTSRTGTNHSGHSDLGAVSELDAEMSNQELDEGQDRRRPHDLGSSSGHGSSSSRSSSQSRASREAIVVSVGGSGSNDYVGNLSVGQTITTESAVV